MAIAFVQSNTGTSALATTTASFAVAPTAGNLIVLGFSSEAYSNAPPSPATQGWIEATGMELQGFHGGYLWYRVSNGSNSLQYTIDSAGASVWTLAEFSGVDTTTPYDISNGQMQAVTASSYATPSIIPTSGARLLVSKVGMSNATTSLVGVATSWSNSFTNIAAIGNNNAPQRDGSGMGYRLVTGDGSTGYSTTGTSTIANTNWTSQIIAFREAVAAPVPPTGFGRLVQSNGGAIAGATSFSATLPGAITAGNLVVISVVADNIPGGANSGWTKSTGMSPVANAQGLLWWFIGAGGDTIPTVTFGSAALAAWRIAEYAGPFDATPYLTSAGAATNVAINPTITSQSITPTAGSNCLIIAGLCGQSGNATEWNVASVTFGSFTNSFLNVTQQFRQAALSAHIASQASRVVASSSGSYSTTATASVPNSSGATTAISSIIAFKQGIAPSAPASSRESGMFTMGRWMGN